MPFTLVLIKLISTISKGVLSKDFSKTMARNPMLCYVAMDITLTCNIFANVSFLNEKKTIFLFT